MAPEPRAQAACPQVLDHTNGERDGGDRFALLMPFDTKPIHDDLEQSLRLDDSIDAAMAADTAGAELPSNISGLGISVLLPDDS